jgi:hypothetical protein
VIEKKKNRLLINYTTISSGQKYMYLKSLEKREVRGEKHLKEY